MEGAISKSPRGSLVENLLSDGRAKEALDSLSGLSSRERVSVVRSLSQDQRRQLSPRNIFLMRGLSSSHSPATRIKQLMFAIFNCTNAAVGSGILAFPRAFRLSGWALGLIITLLAVVVNLYTLMTVLRCARLAGCNSYPATVSKLYGPKVRRAIEVSVFIFCFSCNLSYLLVVGDMVSATLRALGLADAGNSTSVNSFSTSSANFDAGETSFFEGPYFVTLAGWLFVTPLCFFKSLDFLGPASIVGVIGVAFVAATLIYRCADSVVRPPFNQLQAFNFQPCAIQSVPIITFALMAHLTVVPCGIELGEFWPSLRSRSYISERNADMDGDRESMLNVASGEKDESYGDGTTVSEEGEANGLIKPRLRTLVLMCACVMGICWVLYSAVGFSGFALFGLSTRANVINNFGPGSKIVGGKGIEPVTPVIIACQMLMAVSTILGYPTMVYIARQTLFELVGSSPYMSCRYVVVTSAISLLTLALALALRYGGLDISFVISMIGSTVGTAIQFILPSCMIMTLGMRAKGLAFLGTGILFGVLGTGMTIMSAVCDSKSKENASHHSNSMCSTLGF